MFTFYLRHEYYFAAAQLALAMFGMGATLRVGDFVEVFRAPRALAVGLLVQVVGTPLIALAVNALATPPPGIAFGLILVSAMPGGAMSNVVTYFAKGTIALSIALTAVATLGCMITTPLILRLLAAEFVRADFAMPVSSIAVDIAACLLVPLAAGMAVGSARPAARAALARWGIRGSLAVVVCIAVGSAGAGRLDSAAAGWLAPLLTGLLGFATQQAATLASLVLGLRRADAAAIAIESTIRNANLALLLKASLFPVVLGVADPIADSVLFVALLYGAVSGPLSIPLVVVHRMLARRTAA